MQTINTKQLTMIGILIAFGVILASPFFSIMLSLYGVPSFRIDFIALPVIISGLIFGKWYGLITGILVDILGFLLFGIGIYYFGFTINLALAGFLAGFILQHFKHFNHKTLKRILWSLLGFFIVISLVLIWFSTSLNIVLFEEISVGIQILFTVLTMILMLGIPYLVFKFTRKTFQYRQVLMIMMIIIELVFIVLTPIWLLQLYGIPYLPSVLVRIFRASLILPIKMILLETILKTFEILSMSQIKDLI